MIEINRHLENAIRSLESEKARIIQTVREKVLREKVAPHNTEVDQLKAKALAELQKKYEEDRNAIIAKSEENKSVYATTEIEAEVAISVAEIDKAIADLKALIKE